MELRLIRAGAGGADWAASVRHLLSDWEAVES